MACVHNDARPCWPLLLALALIPCAGANAAGLRSVDVSAHFIVPDTASKLVWKYVAATAPKSPFEYTVRDYQQRTVTAGTVSLGEGNTVELVLRLPRGYYDIEFPATGQWFGIVAIALREGRPDPFFCIDGALSWLVPNTPVREALVAISRRCGIAMVRERLNWAEIEPSPGRWQWEGQNGGRGYDTLRRQLVAHQVPALEVFHNAPKWIGVVEKYPEDLVATARSWTAIARHWDTSWGALEVWNEPDIFFGGNLPADQYLAIVKTLAWSRAQAPMKAKLVGGVVAHFEPDFQQCAAHNGMLDIVDVASFHTYGRAESMQDLVGRFRAWTTEHSHGAKPLWLTECGRPWKRGFARPKMEEDQVSALDITMKGVEARACGVERYFAFVYPYYEERENNFGMMGKAATPLRSMAAYVQSVSRLGHMTYLGDWPMTDPAVRRARVFGDDRRAVIVLYTGKVEFKATVNVGLKILKAEGIDGRRLVVAEDSTVPIPDGLTYVTVDRQAVLNKLKDATIARKLLEASRGKPRPLASATPIVVRYQYDGKQVEAKTQGYQVRDVSEHSVAFRCRVFNLDKEARDVTLPLVCPQATAAVSGKHEFQIRLAGNSHQDVTWQVDLSKALADHPRVTFWVRPRCDAVGRITPLAVTLIK